LTAGRNIFCSPEPSGPPLGPTQTPLQWVLVFFPEVKWPRREVDISNPSSAEVKNEWSYPINDFMAWEGKKAYLLELKH